MPKAERTANVQWKGNLREGAGTIISTGSGAFGNLPVTWAARTEASNGLTSPEELLAAAHASCFAMAFSSTLAKAGYTATQLDVKAVCTFEPPKITDYAHRSARDRCPASTRLSLPVSQTRPRRPVARFLPPCATMSKLASRPNWTHRPVATKTDSSQSTNA